MEASTRNPLRPASRLVRRVLLPPLLAAVALLCLLLAVTISFGQRSRADNALSASAQDETAQRLTLDLEGTPTPADIRRAQRPLSERRRLLAAHPYYALYTIASRRFGVSRYLVAAVHYQETGFGRAPAKLARRAVWRRHRHAMRGIVRPTRYPNRSLRHPSVRDDFDLVMAIAAELKAGGARGLGASARRALAARHDTGPAGRMASAMVLERARAWKLLGTLPLPGRGELATPVKGVVGGCGYFGCPRPGHLHSGLDFLAPTGTPIRAADGGRVAAVESVGESGGYGNFVCIQHRPHLATCYAHMSAVAGSMRPGARVRRGEVIGLVGSTGSSSAPHLHFEVRRGPAPCSACAIDPLPLLSGDVPRAALPVIAPVALPATSSAPNDVAPTPVAAAPRQTAPSRAATDSADAEPDAPAAATPRRSRRTPSASQTRRPTPSERKPSNANPAPARPPAPTRPPARPPAPAPTPERAPQAPPPASGDADAAPAVAPPPPEQPAPPDDH